MRTHITKAAAIALCCAIPAAGAEYEIPWHSLDGGGTMAASGGQYQLSGTIAQPDAGMAFSDAYQLVGGFWGVAIDAGEAPLIINSDPKDNAIDARQPSLPNGSNKAGWSSILVVFDADMTGATAADFTVTSDPPGDAPVIDYVNVAGNGVFIGFDQVLPLGRWIVTTYNPTGQSVRIAHLPADVSQDGTSSVADVLKLIDFVNGLVLLPLYASDIDRSGVVGAPDILRTIDLLNGAGVYDVWNLVSLPQ